MQNGFHHCVAAWTSTRLGTLTQKLVNNPFKNLNHGSKSGCVFWNVVQGCYFVCNLWFSKQNFTTVYCVIIVVLYLYVKNLTHGSRSGCVFWNVVQDRHFV